MENKSPRQPAIKQEDCLSKYLLHGNVNTSHPECAQAIADFSCQVCATVFSSKEALLEHEQRLKFHCVKCKKCFKKEVRYWTHIIRVHPSPSDSDSDADTSPCCTNCKLTFPTQVGFDRHMAVVHQTGAVPLDKLEIVQDEIQPTLNEFNYCTRCQFTFVQKADYFTHLVRVHRIEMELDPYPIKVHHTELVPDLNHPHHFCDACEYTFRNNVNFLEHLLRQHGISGLQQQDVVETNVVCCPMCNEEFAHASEFREHVKLHQPQPDAKDVNNYCLACDKTYADIFSFRKHLKRVHQIVYEKPKASHASKTSKRCDTCQITLNNRASYKRHLKSNRHGYILASLKVQSGKASQQKSKVANKQNKEKLKETVAQLLQQLEYKQKPQDDIVTNLLEQLQKHKDTESEQDGYSESVEQQIDNPIEPDTFKNQSIQPDINDPDNWCRVCKRSYASRLNYCKHLECIHHIKLSNLKQLAYNGKTPDINDPNNYCNACEKKFAYRRNYTAHLVRLHDIPRSHLVSTVKYDGVPDLNNTNNTCTACERTYGTSRSFKAHLTRVHWRHLPENKVSRSTNTSAIVSTDAVPGIHASENRCNVCGKDFRSKRSFRIHLMDEHGLHVPKAKQPETEDNLPKRKTRARASRQRKVYTCETCQDTFTSAYIYQYHLAQVHGVKLQEKKLYLPAWINLKETPDLNGPTNTCTACKRKYSSYHSFRNHLARIHRIVLQKESSKLPIHKRASGVKPDVNDARNWCAACDRVYASKYNYRTHLKVRHRMNIPSYSVKTDPRYNENVPDVNDASNWCKACDKVFQTKRSYQNHLGRVHSMHLVVKEEGSLYSVDELSSNNTVAEKRGRNTKKQKITELSKRAVKKQKTPANDTGIRMLHCEECSEYFHDNLLYQIHLVEGHGKKNLVLTNKKKAVQWNLPHDE